MSDATARPSDAEGVSLRKAWLAFGQLIRAADASLPAMPDVLPAELNRTPVGVPALAGNPRKPSRSRWLGLIAAAAAALLVAATCGWWIGRDGKPDKPGSSIAGRGTAEQATPQPEKLPQKAAVAQTGESNGESNEGRHKDIDLG